MSLRFIKLFEEFKKEKLETWSQVRDTIQTKRPFVILIFRTKSSYQDAIASEFESVNFIKQTAYMTVDNKTILYPSIFFTLDREKEVENDIHRYYEEFDLVSAIVGESNSEFSTVYFSDGTSSDFGNEIVSALDPNEIDADDYFKVGSTYYKFIEFHS